MVPTLLLLVQGGRCWGRRGDPMTRPGWRVRSQCSRRAHRWCLLLPPIYLLVAPIWIPSHPESIPKSTKDFSWLGPVMLWPQLLCLHFLTCFPSVTSLRVLNFLGVKSWQCSWPALFTPWSSISTGSISLLFHFLWTSLASPFKILIPWPFTWFIFLLGIDHYLPVR